VSASIEEHVVTEREEGELDVAVPATACPVCGTAHRPGDRFCAHCGAPLTADPREQSATVSPEPAMMTATGALEAASTAEKEDASAWIFAAPPSTVAVGGVLLLLLAAVLLIAGQFDATGTIVMLSFCAAPLGLIVIAIGAVRYVLGQRG
jgi:zinc ribbon protein